MNLHILKVRNSVRSKRKDFAQKLSIVFSLLVVCVALSNINAQSLSFTYQGKLTDNSIPADGTYEMQFTLFDAAANGNQVGATITNATVQVSQGVFTVSLNFGANAFTGPARFLEIGLRSQGNQNPYTVLGSRQAITSAPYAIRSFGAAGADIAANANKLGGIDAVQFVQTSDPRLSDLRIPMPGSPVYIQNTTNQQNLSNFNISGNGTAAGTFSGNVVNAAAQFNLGGSRILGTGLIIGNTFTGFNSGQSITSGDTNSFFGNSAGKTTTTGRANSFFGTNAGFSNDKGVNNSFFGANAGYTNDIAHDNTFIGTVAGNKNYNGNENVFVGSYAGQTNVVGSQHTFIGAGAGATNVNGLGNTLVGDKSDVAFANLINATAIGSNSQVSADNSLVLGSINGINNAIGDTKVGIGTTAPKAKLHIADNSGNILFGSGGCNAGFAGIGFAATLNCSNYSMLGDGSDTIINRPSTGDIIFRENNVTQMTIAAGGRVSINTLGTGGATQLCRNASNQISTCSSSLRYKKNVMPFTPGLNMVKELKPISFDWRDGGMHDLGLGAEDVAKVNELLVIHNDKGEVEGVKYDRIGVVLINAVKEQQAQIERQNNLITTLESRLASVERKNHSHAQRRYKNVKK